MKFVVFVEGPTEKEILGSFLGGWLNGRLSHRVGVQTVKFSGWPGMVKDMPLKARKHLNAPDASKVIAVIALLDLYGPDFYPDSMAQVDDRIEWATKHLENKVGSDRFKVFFAVHEVEAWLLSKPDLFPPAIRDALSRETRGKSPEDIDFDEPPKKLLKRLYLREIGRDYRQVVDGVNLFRRLQPDVAYAACSQLKRMLDEMLRMAREAGQ